MSLVDNNQLSLDNSYQGCVFRYLTSEAITAGQPVCWHLDNNGALTCSKINSSKAEDHFIGIALETANGANQYINVLTSGYCYGRRLSTFPSQSPTLVLLNNLTHNTIFTDKYITSRDNGNTSNYSASQQYQNYFDAGAGNTWTLTLNSAGFEHTTYSLYDRLLVWISDNGETWRKADLQGWESTSSTADYGSSSKGGSTTPKNVCPNYSSGTPRTYIISERWLRFNFHSDSSSQYAGWDITLTASDYDPNAQAEDVPVNTALYVDESDGNLTEDVPTTWIDKVLCRVIVPTASNDRVKVMINK
jgi:hypothetical protein